MKKTIEYAGFSCVGLARGNNEDNCLYHGQYLPENHIDDHFSGTFCVEPGKEDYLNLLGVFDGISGGGQGETASYMAADSFSKKYGNRLPLKDAVKERLYEVNDRIRDYIGTKQFYRMGTTAAMIYFEEADAYIYNVGDSRVYSYYDGKLRQLSKNQVRGNSRLLAQCLGVISVEFRLSPNSNVDDMKKGKRYLLCSDGLYDMVSDKEISRILAKNMSLEDTVESLRAEAYRNGAWDNITVILCEVKFENYL